MLLTQEGKARTFNENLVLAVTLAGVAGATNAIGFLELGTFTSHLSGAGTRIGEALSRSDWRVAWQFGAMIASFAVGAMTATAFIERARYFQTARYSAGLLIEGFALTAYTVATELGSPVPPSWRLPLVALLCFAMGLQNALVTKLSGAVVRTTHLTGIVTDFSIETVRLLVWLWRGMRGRGPLERLWYLAQVGRDPELYRARLHLAIFLSFVSGSAVGSAALLSVGVRAMALPVAMLVALVVYDRVTASSGQETEGDYTPEFIAPDEARVSRPPSKEPAPSGAERTAAVRSPSVSGGGA